MLLIIRSYLPVWQHVKHSEPILICHVNPFLMANFLMFFLITSQNLYYPATPWQVFVYSFVSVSNSIVFLIIVCLYIVLIYITIQTSEPFTCETNVRIPMFACQLFSSNSFSTSVARCHIYLLYTTLLH